MNFTSLLSRERPLFLPQYVSAAPLTAPKPAVLPSCINTNITSAIHTIINITVNVILSAPISTPPSVKQILYYHTNEFYAIGKIVVYVLHFLVSLYNIYLTIIVVYYIFGRFIVKKIFKKLLVRFTAILCSAILLFMSPCSKYMGAINMEHVQATEMVLGYYAGEIAIEWLLAFFASLGLGVAVYDNRDAIEDAFTDYLQTQEFYEEQYGSMQDSCIQVYNINTNTTQDISWQKLLDSLSEFHNDTVDNLTGLYVKYCPALLLSFEDFVNEIINGDIEIPELSVALMDDTFSDYDSIQGSDGLYHISAYGASTKVSYGGVYKLSTRIIHDAVGYRPFGILDSQLESITFYYFSNINMYKVSVIGSSYVAGEYKGDSYSFGIPTDAGYAINIPVFTSSADARDAFVSGDFSNALNYSNTTMESVIDLTKVPDLAPDIPPFTRSWQQKAWERIANAPDIICIGSYGHGVYDDDWSDDIPWIGLESLQEYSHSLLDIYNQIIDDILNGTYDSSEDIPGTYSEAWEQAISDAWQNVVEQSTDSVPGENESDKPTEGEDTDTEDPAEGEEYYKKGLVEIPDDWIEVEAPEELEIKSQSFIDFLKNQGYDPKNWKKIVEKWASPDGTIYQRNYWTDGTDYFYHGEGIEEFFPH